MDVQVESADGITIARLVGDMSASELDRQDHQLTELATGPNARLAVDLSATRLVDSTGLSALMNLVTRARLGGGRVVLVAPTPFVQNVLEITRLDRWFDVFGSMEDARAHLLA